ncbi:hypothetical protein VOLCADRAFT_104133 [Volvox carteri f. nagariensis]|uniref:Peptidase M11 gametolysin domain-containing protein n=1 Tax=Volvox carteri f. nagariensis TaxID=3068 RepID=D8TRG0_VOLCA|nr:uncharacterized protein VOLCADRAFT_104133 [Volvox carteri f. nagariensis]EFJ49986.1 hypothetical protein VOLCADRAFT_104133 [Volvox carteri f. nagariensis]|eukprot:XP_002949051.1 hypothetical protein VOLCADRAFT_104133 [Volvox carteri f. nagariensis]
MGCSGRASLSPTDARIVAFTPHRPYLRFRKKRSYTRLSFRDLLVLLLLAITWKGMSEAATTSFTATTRLKGTLVLRHSHVGYNWKLVSASGEVFSLPRQPTDPTRAPIPPGSFMALDCTSAVGSSDATSCVNIANAEITRLAAPVVSADLEVRLLVMVVNVTGSCVKQGAPVGLVRQAYTSSRFGYASFLRNCSYGKLVFASDPDSVTVIGTTINCSTAILQCSEDAVAFAATTVATNLHGKSFVESFDRYSFVMPANIDACRWVGLADLPGSNTWYSPSLDGIFNKGTVLQEMLHNYGIYHGWKDGYEYGDTSTSMGSGNSCPSAPELWRLGWTTVLDLLNSTSFIPATFKSYILPATSLGPGRNVIKIRPDWQGVSYRKPVAMTSLCVNYCVVAGYLFRILCSYAGYPSRREPWSGNLYIALRRAVAGDEDLDPSYDRKISVHELDKTIDNDFWAKGDPRINIISAIAKNSMVNLVVYNLLVVTGDLQQDGSYITVSLCRYQAYASECYDSITTVDGTSSSARTGDYDYRDASCPRALFTGTALQAAIAAAAPTFKSAAAIVAATSVAISGTAAPADASAAKPQAATAADDGIAPATNGFAASSALTKVSGPAKTALKPKAAGENECATFTTAGIGCAMYVCMYVCTLCIHVHMSTWEWIASLSLR